MRAVYGKSMLIYAFGLIHCRRSELGPQRIKAKSLGENMSVVFIATRNKCCVRLKPFKYRTNLNPAFLVNGTNKWANVQGKKKTAQRQNVVSVIITSVTL